MPLNELTYEQFVDLHDAVKDISYFSKNENKASKEFENKNFREFAKDTIAPYIATNAEQSHRPSVPSRTPTVGSLDAKKQALSGYGMSLVRAATLIRRMDLDNANGLLRKLMVLTHHVCDQNERRMKAESTKVLDALLEPVRKEGKLLGNGEYFPNLTSKKFPTGRSLNKENRIAIATYCGNKSGIQRLLGGEGWTWEQIVPILKTLTNADWDLVEGMWDHFETYKPIWVEMERKQYGKSPTIIEPVPFEITTADGNTRTIKGGYRPITFDPAASPETKVSTAGEITASGAATTRRSFTKERVKGDVLNKPLLLTFNGIFSGFSEVIHDISWRKWLQDMNRLLSNQDIKEAILDHYGKNAYSDLVGNSEKNGWLKSIAAGTSSNSLEAPIGLLRRNFVASKMVLNLVVLPKHFFDITKSVAVISGRQSPIEGWKWVLNVAGDQFTPWQYLAAKKEAFALSKELLYRTTSRLREINEVANRLEGMTKAEKLFTGHGMVVHHAVWIWTDVMTFRAAFKKYLAEGHSEEVAVQLADADLIEAQGSGTKGNLARIEKGSETFKLFTSFWHYFGNTTNMMYLKYATRPPGTIAGIQHVVPMFLQIVSLAVFLDQILKHAQNAITPGKKKKEEDVTFSSLVKEHFVDTAHYTTNFAPFVRDIWPTMGIMLGEKVPPYQGPGGLGIIPEGMKLMVQIRQGQLDDQLIHSMINFIGEGTAAPSSAINNAYDGMKALIKGETVNPLAPILGTRH
jgi:hypothetical protein